MSGLCCCFFGRKDSRDTECQSPKEHVDHQEELHRSPSGEAPFTRPDEAEFGHGIERIVQSREIPFGTPSQLDELIVDDDDDADTVDNPQPHLTRRASAALGAVRSRFIRHLSSESDVKRQSTASIGKSQEEIARRAELRRLRQKRIQDELQDEFQGNQISHQASNASMASVRHGSPTTPLQSQPGGGPRDTIEFAVLEGHQISPKDRSPAPSRGSRSQFVEKNRSPPPSSIIDSQLNADGRDVQHTKSGTPFPHNGTGPSKHPSQTLPHSETRSTFRLSSSPSWLDRIIGVDNAFCENAENPSLDGRSALSIWLAAQGLRSRDTSAASLNCDARQNIVENPHDEISISAATENSCPSHSSESGVQLSKQLSPVRRGPTGSSSPVQDGLVSEPTSNTDHGPQRLSKSPSEDFALDYAAALAFTSPNDLPSSQHPLIIQRSHLDPSQSQPTHCQLDTRDLEDVQLSPLQRKPSPRNRCHRH